MIIKSLKQLYEVLLAEQGPSGWWLADSKEEILLGAVLVQNTNWQNAAYSLENLKQLTAFSPTKLASLDQDTIMEAIRPSGFYRNKSRGIYELLRWLQKWNFEYLTAADTLNNELRDELLSLHGIGQETADVLLLYVFDQPVFVSDTYARRLFEKLAPRTSYPTYQSLARKLPQAQMAAFNLAEAQDFHGQIDEFGKLWLRGGDRFSDSFLKDFQIELEV